jgi:hypothetical protein
VNKTVTASPFRAVADVGSASLEVGHVRDRRNLQPFSTARGPYFNVISDARVKSQVASTELQHTVSKAQLAAGLFGVCDHHLKLVVRILRFTKDVHFNFVELVTALDTAYIATGAHFFTPEAGGVGSVAAG